MPTYADLPHSGTPRAKCSHLLNHFPSEELWSKLLGFPTADTTAMTILLIIAQTCWISHPLSTQTLYLKQNKTPRAFPAQDLCTHCSLSGNVLSCTPACLGLSWNDFLRRPQDTVLVPFWSCHPSLLAFTVLFDDTCVNICQLHCTKLHRGSNYAGRWHFHHRPCVTLWWRDQTNLPVDRECYSTSSLLKRRNWPPCNYMLYKFPIAKLTIHVIWSFPMRETGCSCPVGRGLKWHLSGGNQAGHIYHHAFGWRILFLWLWLTEILWTQRFHYSNVLHYPFYHEEKHK